MSDAEAAGEWVRDRLEDRVFAHDLADAGIGVLSSNVRKGEISGF